MERIVNIRDLGGLPAGSMRVAARRLVRSASLHEASAADVQRLVDHGVRTVIDLRTPWEQDQQPSGWDAGPVVPAPFASDESAIWITRRFEAGTLTAEEMEDWWQLTGGFDAPYDQLRSVRAIFRFLLDAAPDEAVLWHCRGGKDRTGQVAALILIALGVDHAAVVADFLESNTSLAAAPSTEDMQELRGLIASGHLMEPAVQALTAVHEAWLERFLAAIEARSGSVLGYLRNEVALGDDGLAQLRARYLVP